MARTLSICARTTNTNNTDSLLSHGQHDLLCIHGKLYLLHVSVVPLTHLSAQASRGFAVNVGLALLSDSIEHGRSGSADAQGVVVFVATWHADELSHDAFHVQTHLYRSKLGQGALRITQGI